MSESADIIVMGNNFTHRFDVEIKSKIDENNNRKLCGLLKMEFDGCKGKLP